MLFKLSFIKFCQFKSIDHLINDESQIKLCWLILSKNFSVIPIFNYTRVLLNRSCTENQFVSSNTCTIIFIFTYVSYTWSYSKIDFVVPKCVCSHSVLSIIVVHIFLLKWLVKKILLHLLFYFLATEIQNRYKNKKKYYFILIHFIS